MASQARVAIADEIGETLGATITAMLIGERSGLSSPDIVCFTYQPKRGLSAAAVSKKLVWLV